MREARSVVSVAAIVVVSALLYAQPQNEAEQLQRGTRLYGQLRYWDALATFQQASRATDARVALAARKGLVRSALRLAEFFTAYQQADVLYEQAMGDGEAVALSGDALWGAGLFEEAERRYRESLTLAPDVPHAHLGQARALASRGRLDEALTSVLAAASRAPDDVEIQAALADIYERLGRFDDSAAALTRYTVLLAAGDPEKVLRARGHLQLLNAFRGRKPLDIDAASSEQRHTIPFRMVKDKVIVQASVNGRLPRDFIVDTGAEQAALSYATAQEVGVKAISTALSAGVGEAGFGTLQLARLESLQLGSLRIRNVPALLRAKKGAEFNSFSPVPFGLSMSLDYRTRTLTLARALPDDPGSHRLPLRIHRLPFVQGMLNGTVPLSFIVDTGGETMSISADVASTLAPAPRRIPLRVYGTSGFDSSAFMLPGMNLQIGPLSYRDVPLVVLNLRAPSVLLGMQIGGILGHRFLSDYRVVLDLPRSELRLVTD